MMMTGPVDDDEKRPFFYYLSFGPPSLPWSRFPPPGSVPGSGFIRKKDPFFITYTLGTFYPKSVFLGGLGVVGPLLLLRPLSLHPSPVKSMANKKRDLLGPFFVVLVACFKRSFLRFVPFWFWPPGTFGLLYLLPAPGLRPKCRIS